MQDVYVGINNVVCETGRSVESEMLESDIAILNAIDASEKGLSVQMYIDEKLRESIYFDKYLEEIITLNGLEGFDVDYVEDPKAADFALAFKGTEIKGIEKERIFIFTETRDVFLRELLYFSQFYRWMLARNIGNGAAAGITHFSCRTAGTWCVEDKNGFVMNPELIAVLDDSMFSFRRKRRIVRFAA